MRRIFFPIYLVSFLLFGCGGRTANPVMAYQYGDDKKSCSVLQSEISFTQSEISRMMPETSKTGKNVALGVAGLFIWPIWFAMDFSDAERIEVNALRHRYNNLIAIAGEKNCGFDSKPLPEIRVKTEDDECGTTSDC